MWTMQRVGESGGAPSAPLRVADERTHGIGVNLDRNARQSLRVQVLKIAVEIPRAQTRHWRLTLMEPVEESADMPAPVFQCAAREPALIGHPSLEVVEQCGVRSRADRLLLEAPQKQDPSGRDTEKLSAIFARVVTDTCLTADHFDASRRCFKALLIHVQAAVRVQVTGRGHQNPGDPTERRLAEALLAAVLEESFTLDRLRRDLVEHEVRRLHE